MGGKSSQPQAQTIVQRHYVQDPQILKQLANSRNQISHLTQLMHQLQLQLNEAKEEAKKKKDPALYKQLKREAFQIFLSNIKLQNFQEKIPKKDGERHHILIGNISAGKSSLINYACGTKLDVGMGQTTKGIQKVAASTSGKVHIWDSPGANEDFMFYDPDVLAYFHTADRIFILYPDSLKSCKEMIEVLYKVKPSNTFLVRTQCDRCDSNQSKTIEQQLQTDRNLLYQWNIKMEIFATSSKKDDTFLDNSRFKEYLTGIK